MAIQSVNTGAPRPHVVFFTRAIEDKRASREENRPIFRDKIYCEIRFPGDKHSVRVMPADERYKTPPTAEYPEGMNCIELYPEHYKKFEENNSFDGVIGTPLTEAPFLTESLRATLKALNCHTVEALASMSRSGLSKVGPQGMEMQQKANEYLETAKDTGAVRAENEELKKRLAMLEAQMGVNQAEPAADDDHEPIEVKEEDQLTPADFAQPVSELDERVARAKEQFLNMEPADLKAFIADRSGETVSGKVNREQLVEMCVDIIRAENEAAKAGAN